MPNQIDENRSKKTPTSDVGSELISNLNSDSNTKWRKFVLSVLSSIPWIGFISAIVNFHDSYKEEKINGLQKMWIKEYEGKINLLQTTLNEIIVRLNTFDKNVEDRLQSPEYLKLVKRAFRSWDQASTDEKRQMVKNLIMNAAATSLCSDDLVRLFIKWIDEYHEAHFAIIREIYKNPGITRGGIWTTIRGTRPQDDSAEADLFKYLIRDLSLGGVIRIERKTNAQGQFLKRNYKRGKSSTMESAFEDTKPYELTQLGEQFVHYVMEDVAPQLSE